MSAQARPAPEELLGRAITAHGGRERWSEVETITVSLTPSGPVFLAKGRRRDVGRPLSAVISTRAQRAVIEDFGGVPGRQGVFTPERTWIEDADGRVLAEQRDFSRVRGALGSLRRWSDLDQLYFSGYALSTYFTLPFALQWPGVELSATPPVRQRGATLEGIAVRFPAGFVTHSERQRVVLRCGRAAGAARLPGRADRPLRGGRALLRTLLRGGRAAVRAAATGLPSDRSASAAADADPGARYPRLCGRVSGSGER